MRRKFNQRGVVGWGLVLLGVLATGAVVAVGNVIVEGATGEVMTFLRTCCAIIDVAIYSLAAFGYSIFYELASGSLLNSLNLASSSQRLYTLLGIFMLFRLAFSFVKYIINPEGMEKGTSKLISNLAVSLALIVSVPWIFNRAFVLQTYIMDSNVIGNLIMGMNTSSKDTSFNASSYGQAIGFLTFSAFYRVNTPLSDDLSTCANLLSYYDDDLAIENNQLVAEDKNSVEGYIATCVNGLNTISVADGILNTEGNEIGTIMYIASKNMSIGSLTRGTVLNAQYDGEFLINYTPFISGIAGLFLGLLFLNYSFDVAIRNVKLCFMQIIAPIPIILNIEPGDAKGDKKPLNWWIKESLKAYTDLFIRVATVYFGVYLINMLFGGDTVAGYTNNSFSFSVFMILGILLFVKQIPDLIGKAFGIDVKGQFSLNPLKRIGDSRLASMAVGGAIGGVTGLLNSGVAAYAGARSNGASRGEAFRRAITGGIGGAAHSTVSGAKKGAKSIHDITGNVKENLARSGRIAGANVGTTVVGRTGARMSMAASAPTKFDRMQQNSKDMNEMANLFGEVKSFAQSDGTTLAGIDGNTSFKFKNSMGGNSTVDLTRLGISSAKDAHDYVERIKASGASAAQIKLAEDLEKAVLDNYYSAFENDKKHFVGAKLQRFNDLQAKQQNNLSGVGPAVCVNDMKKVVSSIKSQAASYVLSDEYITAERNKNAAAAHKSGGGR